MSKLGHICPPWRMPAQCRVDRSMLCVACRVNFVDGKNVSVGEQIKGNAMIGLMLHEKKRQALAELFLRRMDHPHSLFV